MLRWGAALLALFAASPALADAVVIRSLGPDAERFPVGRVLRSGLEIDLARGSVLGLLDRAGSWELRGALRTRIGKRPVETSTRLQMMQALVRKRKRIPRAAVVASLDPGGTAASAAEVPGAMTRPARTGALRSAAVARIDSAWWQIPLGESGNYCIVADKPVELARVAGPEIDAVLRDESAGRIITFRFGAGSEVAHGAPGDMVIADGRSYALEAPGGLRSTIRLVTIAAPRDAVDLAAALARQGCTRQLEALTSETR